MKNGFYFFLLCLLCLNLSAQERLSGISFNPIIAKKALEEQKGLKKKSIDTVKVWLPFIEDFSNYTGYPNPQLFLDKLAFINTSYPLYPPTLGVATLDALDNSGTLYPQASTRTFPADTLTSQQIRLDTISSPTVKKIDPSDSVYMSFYYQPGGGIGQPWELTGLTPNKQDSLVLEFYRLSDSSWQYVWGTEGFPLDSLVGKGLGYFAYVLVPIVDTGFFNDCFQFRFRNFCTLDQSTKPGFAGNCAQWHIDYIRIDVGRSYQDTAYQDISFVNPAPSLLTKYQAMPASQFLPEDLKSQLQMTMTNLFNTTLSSAYSYEIFDANYNPVAEYPEKVANIPPFLPNHTYQTDSSLASPPVVYQFPSLSPYQKNTYIIRHLQRQGIGSDLRTENDTTTFNQIFWNYYAYDDGSAENGYGLESKIVGGKIALRFTPKKTDTLTSIEIYFNKTVDSGNYIPFNLIVWDSDNGFPYKELYRNSEPVYPKFNDLNDFGRYVLETPLLVKDTFYIGLEQLSINFLNIGFDRNTNSSEDLFYKVSNNWSNSFLTGSLMMRPYFGWEGTLDIESPQNKNETCDFVIFPNPVSQGQFHIKPKNDFSQTGDWKIQLYDLQGRLVLQTPFKEIIDVHNLKQGIYLLRIENKKAGSFYTTKLMIK